MKATYLVLFVCFLFITSTGFSQSAKEYSFTDFSEIKVGFAFDVEIKQGDGYKFVVECEDKMMSYLDIEQEGQEVKIGMKSWKGSSNESPRVSITMPDLNELDMSGACDVKLVGFTLDKLEIEVSGASELQGDMDAKNVEIDASGASSVGLSGRTERLALEFSGASAFKGKGFNVTGELIMDGSGASSAYCQVDGVMEIELSGASTFTYFGEGKIVNQDLSGASEIKKQ